MPLFGQNPHHFGRNKDNRPHKNHDVDIPFMQLYDPTQKGQRDSCQVVGFFRACMTASKPRASWLLLWQDDRFESCALAIDDVGLGPAQLDPSGLPGRGPAWSARSTLRRLLGLLRVRPTKTTEADLDGLHVVVGDLLRRRPRCRGARRRRFIASVSPEPGARAARAIRAAARRVAGASER